MGKQSTFLRALALACALACMCALFAGCSQTGVGAAESRISTSSAASQEAGERLVDVSLSGGSGKASVLSPAKVAEAEDGSLTLTLTWSSSHYERMVVDGAEYFPVNAEGNSTFEIPVATLDADLPVQAETTAMSEPHLIDYVLSFNAGAGADGEGNGIAASGSATTQVADFHNADLGCGWQVARSMPLDFAKCFTVDYFDGGYKLLCLSDGGRYLTVPEGAETPAGLAEDIEVVHQPVGDIYLAASDAMCLFESLGALDCITVSGIAKDNWHVDAAVQAMDSGRMAYGGKYNAPDYELLLGSGVRLAVESTMINHTPAVREKLIELGIPVFTEMSSYEPEPLGRCEWVKCYGALLDEEDGAQALFDEQMAKVSAVGNASTGKSVAFFYINSNGNAVVRQPGDYVTKMIEQAGGVTAFDQLDQAEGSTSSVTLEMERFYAMAKDADVIIYNASIDGSVSSLDDLLAKNALLGDFKAVRSGDVWVTDQNMYQQMVRTGRIIADFSVAISGSGAPTEFVHKLG